MTWVKDSVGAYFERGRGGDCSVRGAFKDTTSRGACKDELVSLGEEGCREDSSL